MEDLASFLSQHELAITVFGGLVIVALAIVFGRSAAAPAPEPTRNPAAEWRTLCRRMEEAVRDHPTGRLVFSVVREYKPHGGEALIKWEFDEQSEFVVAVRFFREQPGDEIYHLAEKRGVGEWKRREVLTKIQFKSFVDCLERAIRKYVSPLSRT